jgi:hypothetical protein
MIIMLVIACIIGGAVLKNRDGGGPPFVLSV